MFRYRGIHQGWRGVIDQESVSPRRGEGLPESIRKSGWKSCIRQEKIHEFHWIFFELRKIPTKAIWLKTRWFWERVLCARYMPGKIANWIYEWSKTLLICDLPLKIREPVRDHRCQYFWRFNMEIRLLQLGWMGLPIQEPCWTKRVPHGWMQSVNFFSTSSLLMWLLKKGFNCPQNDAKVGDLETTFGRETSEAPVLQQSNHHLLCHVGRLYLEVAQVTPSSCAREGGETNKAYRKVKGWERSRIDLPGCCHLKGCNILKLHLERIFFLSFFGSYRPRLES